MKRMVRVALAVAVCLTLFSGCGTGSENPPGDNGSESTSQKSFVIYSDNAFAPFEYFDTKTNTYVGIDMDILAAIAEDQAFEYIVKNEGFDASMGAVQSGQADGMIAGMTITDERKETYDFSDGYFEAGQIMVVAANGSVNSLEDLNGKVVACKVSTMGTEYAESIKDEYGFTIQYYEDSPTMYTAVINGINAACFEDNTVIGWAIKTEIPDLKTIGDVINPKYYGFAVKKGQNGDLLEMFNAGLRNIKDNGKYNAILANYGY